MTPVALILDANHMTMRLCSTLRHTLLLLWKYFHISWCTCVLCRLLHPFMPFVTEELWQRLPRTAANNSAGASHSASLMVASYPQTIPAWADPTLNEQMEFLSSIASGVGKLRTDYKLASSKRPHLSIFCSDSARGMLIEARSLELTTLALASSLEVSTVLGPACTRILCLSGLPWTYRLLCIHSGNRI